MESNRSKELVTYFKNCVNIYSLDVVLLAMVN
jgi:hypothetical protein